MFMKKLAAAASVLLMAGTLSAQTVPSLDGVKDIFKTFGETIAPSLPLNAAVGANWSDAYIGSILGVPPHAGLGITLGGTMIPAQGIKDLVRAFDTSQSIPDFLLVGVPVPSLVVDGRVGGIILPFDVGFKVGFLPEAAAKMVNSDNFRLEYLMYGADVRYAVIEENLVLPGVSVGAGYTFLKTVVGFKPFGGNVQLAEVPYIKDENAIPTADPVDDYHSNGAIVLTNPELRVGWNTSVIDLKVHVDKNLIFIMPYAGLGASLGLSQAGGGIYTSLQYQDQFGNVLTDGSGNPITGAAVATAVKEAAANYPELADKIPDIAEDGIYSFAGVNGWSFRLYGGTSINAIPFLRIDIQGMYDFIGKSYGGSLGLRVQL